MTLFCQNPDCDHEFEEDFGGLADPMAEHELPVYSVQYVPGDGFGVATDYVCSKSCMREYLDAEVEVAP